MSIINTVPVYRVIGAKVTDEAGKPIEGVSIQVKHSATVTATDAQGHYKLSVPEGKQLIIFTAVGYKSFEANISNNILNAILRKGEKVLEELVVAH